MSYLGGHAEGVVAVEAGAGVLTGTAAMKSAPMGSVVIAEGMMTGIATTKVIAGGIEVQARGTGGTVVQ